MKSHKEVIEQVGKWRGAVRGKSHHTLHHAHHLLHLGYLISILSESHSVHIVTCAALVTVIVIGTALGDEF